MKQLLLSTALTLAAWASPSVACHRISPDEATIESYDAVFLGRVTGIHLVGYENALVGGPDAVVDGVQLSITDGSAPVAVKVVPLKIRHGKVASPAELQLVGCTDPLPELKERGLFFVNPKSNSAVTVWESDKMNFSRWLERLGLSGDEAELNIQADAFGAA